MSEDKRETILARLLVVAESIVGAGKAFRNTLQVPENVRPAILILDADEEADESGYDRGRPAFGPAIVMLSPEIHLLLGDDQEDVGTALNALRAQVIKAIVTDASLVAACLKGDIRFQGFATGLSAGRLMEAQGLLSMGFRYMLRPDKL